MQILCIKSFENGAHDNIQNDYITAPPEGWAVIPDDMVCENFPFGEVTVEEVEGVMTVTSWTPLPMPEPEPVPEPEVTTAELAAAIREGVNGI